MSLMYLHSKKSRGVIIGEHRGNITGPLYQNQCPGNVCQEIIWQYEHSLKVHCFAGTLHLTGDLPSGLTDTTVAFQAGHNCHLFYKKRVPTLSNMTKQPLHYISISQMTWGFFWSLYSAVMTVYPLWYVKQCFTTKCPSPKIIFISFSVWQNVFSKLKMAGFIIWL